MMIALCTGPYTHLDHLGVLAHLLEIPLIVTEEKHYQLAKQFYPGLKVQLKDFQDLSLDYLSSFDFILQSGRLFYMQLAPLLQMHTKTPPRIVFCPHGNSDKGHSFTHHPPQDIALVYGDHMMDLLKQTGALALCKETLVIGNYRLAHFQKQRFFYQDLIAKKIDLTPSRKTILYAPTWEDGENSSSFLSTSKELLELLSKNFNVIVKLHPFLEERSFSLPQVTFLEDFPIIYPLLELCDLYLGDYSSIGFDFLAFNKPLYFLKGSKGKSLLHQTGLVIPSEENPSTFIENSLERNQNDFEQKRKETYLYAFGKGKHLDELLAGKNVNQLELI